MCTIEASQMLQYTGIGSRPVCSPACREPASFRRNDTGLSWWTRAVSVCSLIICQSYKNNKIFYLSLKVTTFYPSSTPLEPNCCVWFQVHTLKKGAIRRSGPRGPFYTCLRWPRRLSSVA